jgi:hypothetical protein
VDGASWVDIAGIQILIPSVIRSAKLPSPEGNVQRIFRGRFLDAFHDSSGTLSVMPFTDVLATTQGIA